MVKNNVALVPTSRKRYLGTTLKVRMDLFSRIHNIWKKNTVKVALILLDLFDTVT